MRDGSLVHTADYLQKRMAAALAGQVFNPTIGYETTASLHIKYPYTPFKKDSVRECRSPGIQLSSPGLLAQLFRPGKYGYSRRLWQSPTAA
jgi:hypothetical protein